MSNWVKRKEPPSRFFSDIWDGDGWQINLDMCGKYVLIDADMPLIPASPVYGSFDTFEEAASAADRLGKPDWSEWADEC